MEHRAYFPFPVLLNTVRLFCHIPCKLCALKTQPSLMQDQSPSPSPFLSCVFSSPRLTFSPSSFLVLLLFLSCKMFPHSWIIFSQVPSLSLYSLNCALQSLLTWAVTTCHTQPCAAWQKQRLGLLQGQQPC